MLFKNKYETFDFDSKIQKAESTIKINENICNIYKSFNNNYFNAVNINNILVSYSKNKLNNEKMKKILGNDYDRIINMIMNKYIEGINMIENKNELEELKMKIKEEKIKSETLSFMNIDLSKKNKKKEEENLILNEQIKEIKESLNNVIKEKEEINEKIKKK